MQSTGLPTTTTSTDDLPETGLCQKGSHPSWCIGGLPLMTDGSGHHMIDALLPDRFGLAIEHTAKVWDEIQIPASMYYAQPYGSRIQVSVQVTEYTNWEFSHPYISIEGADRVRDEDAGKLIRQIREAARFIRENESAMLSEVQR
jgi:hypothetical protein